MAKRKSEAEELFDFQLKALKLPPFEREFHFHPIRKWRFDFAWPADYYKLAVEVEGITSYGKNKDGSMKLGRHQTAKGVEEDCIKYGEAMLLGWRVYRCTPKMIKQGIAINTVEQLLRARK